jgi:hypothetical protein
MIVRESIEFKRASSDREIKEKLFGWRKGQILVGMSGKTNHQRLFVFAGFSYKNNLGDLRIRCLEIGHISGIPLLVYIHFGFYEDFLLRKEKDLKIPTDEQAIAIRKAMEKEDFKKYVLKSEEKI